MMLLHIRKKNICRETSLKPPTCVSFPSFCLWWLLFYSLTHAHKLINPDLSSRMMLPICDVCGINSAGVSEGSPEQVMMGSHRLLSDSSNKQDLVMTDRLWYAYWRWKKREKHPQVPYDEVVLLSSNLKASYSTCMKCQFSLHVFYPPTFRVYFILYLYSVSLIADVLTLILWFVLCVLNLQYKINVIG